MSLRSYKTTKLACFVGIISQAVVVNVTPVLFIPLRTLYGLTYEQLGLLIFVNFVVQIAVDIGIGLVADRIGPRRVALAATGLAAMGMLLFASTPWLFPTHIYLGLMIGTVVFASAGGLLELITSPIFNALPSDEKAAGMSLLHSLYAWGQVAVVLLTSLTIAVFGAAVWWVVPIFWTLLPLTAGVLYYFGKFGPMAAEEHRKPDRASLLSRGMMWLLVLMFCAGAAELCMSQWSSAFLERAASFNKLTGDLLGMCAFGVALGIGRLWYGIAGPRMNLARVMTWGAAGAVACYALAALSPWGWVSLVCCAACGFFVSLLWPGTLVLGTIRFPHAGTWMFALFAAAGDIGGALGPWMSGVVADNAARVGWIAALGERLGIGDEQMGLRLGLLLGIIFAVGAFAALLKLRPKTNE